jgi:putative resolvase
MLRRVLSDRGATVLIMELRDRLARLGVEDLEAALSVSGRWLVLLERDETIRDPVMR